MFNHKLRGVDLVGTFVASVCFGGLKIAPIHIQEHFLFKSRAEHANEKLEYSFETRVFAVTDKRAATSF
jgi:hypothetical protein